jgi:hypothetical protein
MFYRLIAIFSVLSVASASAQTSVVPPASNCMTIVSEPRDAAVRAQVSITFVVPGPADDASPEAEKTREGARRSMYEVAARECGLLLAVLEGECRLENVNVNVSRQTGPRTEGFAVRGNMTYRITPK